MSADTASLATLATDRATDPVATLRAIPRHHTVTIPVVIHDEARLMDASRALFAANGGDREHADIPWSINQAVLECLMFGDGSPMDYGFALVTS